MSVVGLKFVRPSYSYGYWFARTELTLTDTLGSEIMSPPDTMQGEFLLDVGTDGCQLKNIRIEFEGHAISCSEAKNRPYVNIVDVDVDNPKDEIFTPEDLCAFPLDYEIQKYLQETYTFPFKIELRGQELPAKLKSTFDEICYKLVANVNHVKPRELLTVDSATFTTKGQLNLNSHPKSSKLQWVVNVKEKSWFCTRPIFMTKSHLNLHPKLKEPQSVTKQKGKPLFSTRPLCKVHFRVGKNGLVPQETGNFAIIVANPTCEKIVKMKMVLNQKIIYYSNSNSRFAIKMRRNVLHEREKVVDSYDADIRWKAEFEIPTNSMPSFKKGRKYLEIYYRIEFTVWMADAPPLKGELAIVIGTTKSVGAAPNLKLPLNLATKTGVSRYDPAPNLNRSQSCSNLNKDALSLLSCPTLPPSYSNLPSRKPSLSYIETLPPNYASLKSEGQSR